MSVTSFIEQLPEERRSAIYQLQQIFSTHLPEGFEESLRGGFISYDVPHSIFPAGYHCKPSDPLPFIAIASQKNFIAIYHMGIYSDKNLLDWFVEAYSQQCTTKLDMGKSCIRFKKIDKIPYDLLIELAKKMSVQEWIDIYTSVLKK